MAEGKRPPGATPEGAPSDSGAVDGPSRALAQPLVEQLLRALDGAALVLDGDGRVAALAPGFLAERGVDGATALLGLAVGAPLPGAGSLAPGEPPPPASPCAAAIAGAVEALDRGEPPVRTCSLSVRRDGVTLDLDLRVRAAPLDLDGRRLTLVTLADVSGERRRATQERTWLHDLTNLTAGLTGACGALDDPDPAEARAAADDLRLLVARLSREVQLQRALSSGRPGAMRMAVERVAIGPLVERLRQAYQGSRAWAGKRLTVSLPPEGTVLETDPGLLQRLIGQMLANAFEATDDGGEVRLAVTAGDGEVEFRAWNAGAMPAAVVPRIFERYFSTKGGEGRGQGTYALKVIGEAYLRGRVSFTTGEAEGTTFVLRLPRSAGAALPPWARGAEPI